MTTNPERTLGRTTELSLEPVGEAPAEPPSHYRLVVEGRVVRDRLPPPPLGSPMDLLRKRMIHHCGRVPQLEELYRPELAGTPFVVSKSQPPALGLQPAITEEPPMIEDATPAAELLIDASQGHIHPVQIDTRAIFHEVLWKFDSAKPAPPEVAEFGTLLFEPERTGFTDIDLYDEPTTSQNLRVQARTQLFREHGKPVIEINLGVTPDATRLLLFHDEGSPPEVIEFVPEMAQFLTDANETVAHEVMGEETLRAIIEDYDAVPLLTVQPLIYTDRGPTLHDTPLLHELIALVRARGGMYIADESMTLGLGGHGGERLLAWEDLMHSESERPDAVLASLGFENGFREGEGPAWLGAVARGERLAQAHSSGNKPSSTSLQIALRARAGVEALRKMQELMPAAIEGANTMYDQLPGPNLNHARDFQRVGIKNISRIGRLVTLGFENPEAVQRFYAAAVAANLELAPTIDQRRLLIALPFDAVDNGRSEPDEVVRIVHQVVHDIIQNL